MHAPQSAIRTRRGFTLVELLVAMALSLFIMVILTESFKIAIDFVRGANSTGNMITQLNGAGNALKRDLEAEHFFPDDSRPNRGVRLSDLRFDQGATAPLGGFFRIVCPAPTILSTDQDGVGVNSASHILHFTTILPGGSDQNQFSALSPAGGGSAYTGRAAEVAYFLSQTGQTSVNGMPLYNLIRRYRLVAVGSEDLPLIGRTGSDTTANYQDVVSSSDGGTTAATLSNINSFRMALAPFAPINGHYGEDILASNVLSFEVLPWWDGNGGSPAFAFTAGNSDGPYAALPAGFFDTATVPPQGYRIRSLQITLRIYDPKMKQTRQNTWKFAM